MRQNESRLQKAVAKLLDASGLLWCAIPNGGNRSAITGARMKAEGVKRGVPDLFIFEPKLMYATPPVHEFVGVAIELKAVLKGGVTEFQAAWLEQLAAKGWRTAVCRSTDDVLSVLRSCYPDKFR